jgi:hypothetical protein
MNTRVSLHQLYIVQAYSAIMTVNEIWAAGAAPDGHDDADAHGIATAAMQRRHA